MINIGECGRICNSWLCVCVCVCVCMYLWCGVNRNSAPSVEQLSFRELLNRIPGDLKGKAVPLQGWSGPEGSRKLRFPDFVTAARDGGRLSALRTGRLYTQEMLLVLISFSAIGRILCQ